MPKAQEFREWVVSEVLPIARRNKKLYKNFKPNEMFESIGTQMDRIEKENHELSDKNKTLTEENKILKHNQKHPVFKKGGQIYVVRPPGSRHKRLVKVGRTQNMNKRDSSYNTSTPDKFDVLVTMPTKDPVRMEACVKLALEDDQYIHNKEYYETSIAHIKDVFRKCEQLFNVKVKCNKCMKGGSSEEQFHESDLDDVEIFEFEFDEDYPDDHVNKIYDFIESEFQSGGYTDNSEDSDNEPESVPNDPDINYYAKYVKYKSKYIQLKEEMQRTQYHNQL